MSNKPSYENKVERIAHGCVKWSERRIVFIKAHHGRDEILSKETIEVKDCQQSSFNNLLGVLLSFVSPLVPEKERGKHRYAFVVQAPSLDLFGQDCWDDISISWL